MFNNITDERTTRSGANTINYVESSPSIYVLFQTNVGVLTCFIRMHCLHRKFIHTLHDRLVNAAATRNARRAVAANSNSWSASSVNDSAAEVVLVVVLRNISIVTSTAVSALLAIVHRLGHRVCGRGAPRGQRGGRRTRRGLVNRVTGSVGGEEEETRR